MSSRTQEQSRLYILDQRAFW